MASFHRKQEKKREKIAKILAKREARKAAGLINDESDEVILIVVSGNTTFSICLILTYVCALDTVFIAFCSKFLGSLQRNWSNG